MRSPTTGLAAGLALTLAHGWTVTMNRRVGGMDSEAPQEQVGPVGIRNVRCPAQLPVKNGAKPCPARARAGPSQELRHMLSILVGSGCCRAFMRVLSAFCNHFPVYPPPPPPPPWTVPAERATVPLTPGRNGQSTVMPIVRHSWLPAATPLTLSKALR